MNIIFKIVPALFIFVCYSCSNTPHSLIKPLTSVTDSSIADSTAIPVLGIRDSLTTTTTGFPCISFTVRNKPLAKVLDEDISHYSSPTVFVSYCNSDIDSLGLPVTLSVHDMPVDKVMVLLMKKQPKLDYSIRLTRDTIPDIVFKRKVK